MNLDHSWGLEFLAVVRGEDPFEALRAQGRTPGGPSQGGGGRLAVGVLSIFCEGY